MTVISLPVPSPSIVVFGRDHAGKPHASWFDQASADLATKAAGLMNMHAVPVDGEALRELAVTLPRGRVFSSGKAFTPFVNRKLYGRLVELTRDLLGVSTNEGRGEASRENPEPVIGQQGHLALTSGPAAGEDGGENGAEVEGQSASKSAQAQNTGKPAQGSAPPSKGKPRPSRPDEVGLGSLVLVEDRAEGGWYEAEVIGINGAMLTLKWRDFADPTVVRGRHELGFLPALSV